MKKSIFSLFLFGAVLSAAPVSVQLVSASSEIGPYTISVNGQDVQAMCMDDFLSNSIGETWSANVTAVNGTNFSNTYFGNQAVNVGGYNVTASEVYGIEAYLFSEITRPNADRTDIQEAAWAVMDPVTLANVVGSNNTAVEGYLEGALANYSSLNTAGYEILSDVSINCNSAQEFMIQTSAAPEPATFALFGFGLVAAGATRFLRKKKPLNA